MRRRVLFGTAELVRDRQAPSVWRLFVDDVLQSCVDIADPTNLGMSYTRWVAQLVDRRWAAGTEITAVHVGGGGFTVPRYVAGTRPGSDQTVFELDGELVELVREHLDLDAVPGVRVEVRDGMAGVDDLPEASADLVVLDVFRAGAVATELATVEAVTRLARVLRPDGLYVANLWDGGELDFLVRAAASVGEVFQHVVVISEAGILMGNRPGNLVVAASAAELPVAELTEWATADPGTVHCLTPRLLAAVCGTGAPLTEADPLAGAVPAVRTRLGAVPKPSSSEDVH
jgi:spermidine synthase